MLSPYFIFGAEMSPWILIFWVGGPMSYGGGPATAEFYDQQSCEHALQIANKRWVTFEGFCVPKRLSN